MIGETVQILAGWYLADLLTGLAHLAFDRAHCLRDWPIIGPLHRDSVQHHADPHEIVGRSAWETSWKPVVATLLIVAGLELLLPPLIGTWLPWVVIPMAIGGVLSTRAHVWAHRPINNALITTMQSYGLILRSEGHARHHSGGHTRGYAALNGWSDPVIDWALDRLGW